MSSSAILFPVTSEEEETLRNMTLGTSYLTGNHTWTASSDTTAMSSAATNWSSPGDPGDTYPMMATELARPAFNNMSIVKTSTLGTISLLAIIGNALAIYQMYKMRRRRSTINLLILHLAVADLLVTFFCNLTEAIWASTIQWYAGDVACRLVKFLSSFGLYLSTYIIVIISLDRCFAIMDPMSRNKAPKRVKIMIGVAWTLSAVFSLPQVSLNRPKLGTGNV